MYNVICYGNDKCLVVDKKYDIYKVYSILKTYCDIKHELFGQAQHVLIIENSTFTIDDFKIINHMCNQNKYEMFENHKCLDPYLYIVTTNYRVKDIIIKMIDEKILKFLFDFWDKSDYSEKLIKEAKEYLNKLYNEKIIKDIIE